ncbi:MAG: hypothetical protein VKL39_24135 [Leptolyngbyaceae bacterium]|nr:hypothetical protein [Leptolyngbyaceae bacterium]
MLPERACDAEPVRGYLPVAKPPHPPELGARNLPAKRLGGDLGVVPSPAVPRRGAGGVHRRALGNSAATAATNAATVKSATARVIEGTARTYTDPRSSSTPNVGCDATLWETTDWTSTPFGGYCPERGLRGRERRPRARRGRPRLDSVGATGAGTPSSAPAPG